MVNSVIRRVRPKYGFAHFFHLSLTAVMPIVAYVFVRLDFYGIAVAIVLLSKWRMFAVKPRHWLAHIRTNAVDIIVSLSFVSFMIAANGSMALQLVWLALFEAWVIYLKPGTSTLHVSIQALVAQLVGLIALFLSFETAPTSAYVLIAGIISYFSARHFFNAYEEKHAVHYSWLWCFFGASLMWILSHWLLFYGPVAQVAVLTSIIGYGLASLYFLHEHDKLTLMVRRQIMFVVSAVVFVMLALANWGDGIIK